MPRTSRARPVLNDVENLDHLEDLWDEPAPCSSPSCSLLRGAWQTIAGRREGRLLISGGSLTLEFADGTVYMGKVTIGRTGRFATMDVRVEEGPPKHKGQLALCIYEINGETLDWCTASPGQTERPTEFAERDPQHLHLVFRREPSNRKG